MEQIESGDAASLIQSPEVQQDDPEPSGSRINLLLDSYRNFNKDDCLNRFPVTQKISEFIDKFFPGLSSESWNNWHWQIKNSITDYSILNRIFYNSPEFSNLVEQRLPFRITPYYASIAYNSEKIRKTVIPSSSELIVSEGESIDPLNEDHDRSEHCIVHRYPDRVLLLATNFCSVNCRYCTRSRIVSNKHFSKKQVSRWDAAFEYIRNHPEVRDVVISGGDPLTLPSVSLEYILSNLKSIPHVEMIRIGTKVPVVMPMRITKKLAKMIKKYNPVYFSIHFTHPDEITDEVREACSILADNGFPLGSQTVLLKDINDSPEILKELYHKLLTIRVRPYYLYQCDPIIGSAHFKTPVSKGVEIIESLRGWTSGYAVPHFVIDAPGGGGKIPVIPNYRLPNDENGNIILRNYENNTYKYYDR